MTDDIVTRLREIADADVYRADISVSKLYEAADEIERLRAICTVLVNAPVKSSAWNNAKQLWAVKRGL